MIDIEDFLDNYSNTGYMPYIVVNGNNPLPTSVKEKELQILDIKEAEKGNLLDNLSVQENDWKEYTGYYIKTSPHTTHSVQTCFLTSTDTSVQNVRNVIVVEEGSKLEIFTGCLSNSHVKTNTHNATTDIFVRKDATIIFNMFHSWGENSIVKPKARIYVEDGGTYISNYVLWDKVRSIVSNPKIVLKENAKAVSHALAYVHPDSEIDLGGDILLEGKNSSGEIISSVVSNGGEFISKTNINGKGDDSKGHVECNALLINPLGKVIAIPQLQSENDKTQLTHEASLGRISNEEIEYLQTKGLSEEKAKELITRGFVNKSVENMPDIVKQRITSISSISEQGF